MADDKVHVYFARVSTVDQHPENQTLAIVEDAKRRGLPDSQIRGFIDRCSGRLSSMPERNKALALVKAGRVSTFTVYRLDRLSRSVKDLVTIIEMLKVNNVVFRSITEAIDTGTSAGMLMYNLLASFSQFERDLCSERTRLAIQRLKAQGRVLGRPRGKKDSKSKSYKNRSRGAAVGWYHRRERQGKEGIGKSAILASM